MRQQCSRLVHLKFFRLFRYAQIFYVNLKKNLYNHDYIFSNEKSAAFYIVANIKNILVWQFVLKKMQEKKINAVSVDMLNIFWRLFGEYRCRKKIANWICIKIFTLSHCFARLKLYFQQFHCEFYSNRINLFWKTCKVKIDMIYIYASILRNISQV